MNNVQKEANRLVNKFMFADIYFTDGKKGAIMNAKFCAGMCLDEIINELKEFDNMDGYALSRISFCNEVKAEIERL